jgi:hypothetical protein
MTLLQQLENDRYDEAQCSMGADPVINRMQRQTWNAAIDHAIGVIKMHLGIPEIVEAPAMDLRLRAALMEAA